MKKFKLVVKTAHKNYPIIIGENILKKAGKIIRSLLPRCKKIALIVDTNVPKKKLDEIFKFRFPNHCNIRAFWLDWLFIRPTLSWFESILFYWFTVYWCRYCFVSFMDLHFLNNVFIFNPFSIINFIFFNLYEIILIKLYKKSCKICTPSN